MLHVVLHQQLPGTPGFIPVYKKMFFSAPQRLCGK